MAEPMGHPDWLVSIYTGGWPPELDWRSKTTSGHRQGRHHSLPRSVRGVFAARRADARPGPHRPHLSVRHLAGECGLLGPIALHVLPHVLRLCEPRVRCPNTAAHSQLEA
uniref:Uncharacterized protein n=2 Tax=Timema TaxID=61471 RepID=A0A7R9BC12_TIMSH|nr:unnamed protein product [Timema shepardi]CAD7581840.1 unnamed protein product [Timema californicum]